MKITQHSRIRRFWCDCAAREIVEAAFVLPLLFVFIFGVLQFARVYVIYSTLQRAAQEGAHAAAGSYCATCPTVPLTAATVATNFVHPVFNVSHVDDTPLIAIPPSTNLLSCADGVTVIPCDPAGTGATPAVCLRQNVILNISTVGGGPPTSGTPVCGTALSLTYPYGFSLPSVSTSPPYISRQTFSLNLKAQAHVVGEN